MCQISVIMERDGARETVMENVTGLDLTSGGVRLTTFFEEPKTLAGVVISHIDFLGGKVILKMAEASQGRREEHNERFE